MRLFVPRREVSNPLNGGEVVTLKKKKAKPEAGVEVVTWGYKRKRKAKCRVTVDKEMGFVEWVRVDIPDVMVYDVDGGMSDVDHVIIAEYNEKGGYQIKLTDYEAVKGVFISNDKLTAKEVAELTGLGLSVAQKIIPRIKDAVKIAQHSPTD